MECLRENLAEVTKRKYVDRQILKEISQSLGVNVLRV